MSFTDEYLALQKKKKKKEEETTENIAPLYTNKTTAFFNKTMNTLPLPAADTTADEIKKSIMDKIAPVKEEEDERKWFEKGAFEDGYQFGDVTKTILGIGKDKDTVSLSPTEKLESLYSVYGAEDFANKSGYVSTKADGFWDKFGSKYGMGYNDLQYEYINNQNGIRDEIKYKAISWGSDTGKTTSSYEEKALDYMTDDEVAVYNYYYQTEGKEKAQEFLDALAETLSARKAGKQFAGIKGKTGAEVLLGVVAGDEQFKQGVKNLGNMIVGKDDYIPLTSTQILSGMIREDLAGDDDGFKVLGNSIAQVGYDVLSTGTNMIPSIAVGAVNPVAGAVLMGSSAAGNAYQQDLNEGNDKDEARLYATTIGVLEGTLQYALGGIGKLGGVSPAINRAVSGIKNGALRFALEYGGKIGAEALEEGLQEVLDPIVKNAIHGTDESIDWEKAVYSAFLGGLMGGTFGFSEVSQNSLSKNEQAVLDKVFKDAVAEREKNGKLTAREKNKIFDEVTRDLEKGYISTDTIEEVLGDKSAYDSLAKESEEYDTLYNTASGQLSKAQQDRLAELEEKNKVNPYKDALKAAKDQNSQSVFELVKNDRLSESYNERARRGQAFTADLTKYDAKQQQTIQKAIDSGILNNTNRTHEFVDIIAKISADTGVLFDFTNNTKLKESGFAIDGKQVNGFVTKDGITLNIDSPKAWQSTVGHEVTHILEGTELYTELQNTLFEYAKSKGEYQSRYDSLTELYKNVKDANIEAELTADLVGDYLFQDSNFINTLSTKNRNVFEKIYDEIKYLCKVVTAGSKEARELEKVRKAFENAYRAEGKASGDTKYSVSDKNIKDVSTGYASGETYFTMSYEQDGKVVGTLEYGEYDGEPNVKMIEVDPEYRRKGIATKLMQELQNKYPDTEINFGMATPDGSKLLDSITYDVTDEAVVADRQKLKDLQTELNELQEKLDVLFDTENLTEAQDAEMHNLGDRWQEVYESIHELSKNLRGKKATRTFVKTDAKYSLSDSDGKQLSKEQQDFFKDSKMRDENGNLKVMYHGSQDAGFHIFDAKMSDDDTSLFFVDRNDVAASYSGTSETYEAKTIRSAEDMNNFLAEIGYDHYKAVEKDGKFELLENNEHIAYSDTAQGLYEEFCWYEGVGDGDANYKVYLNLKNPLEVDAGGRNWNDVSRDFSQEIYDAYQSLTETEKEHLVQLASWEDHSVFRDEILDAVEGDSTEEYALSYRSTYNKLGGKDADLGNLFAVASEGFTDESIRENAVKRMNTRDYSQKAKAEGYDGVIFKNIVDVGGYGGEYSPSTVAIAFDSNQIKSTANTKPTGDPDIRYSLTEYTDEEKQAHNKAVLDHFGKTYRWAETGYVLLDGSRLDLSGKHEGAPGGYRTVDHRDIVDALGSDYGDDTYSGSLVQFMSEGNIRISPESNGINLSVKPNKAQEAALASFVQNAHGEVMLDIDDAKGYTVVSVEYPSGTSAYKVLKDIREWFDNGTEPQVSGFSQFRSLSNNGEQSKKYGSFYTPAKELRLETPTKETISKPETVAPVVSAENATTTPVTQEDSQSLFPDNLAPIQGELEKLYDEQEMLYMELENAIDNGNADDVDRLAGKYDALSAKIRELEAEDSERVGTLDDSNVPPETEVYPGESNTETVEDPFEDRDWYKVGNQKVKAYMYENPEVKPFFQAEAQNLLGEWNDTTRGERWYNDQLHYESGGELGFGGTKRHTSRSMETLLDEWGMSYDDIKKGLNAIIEDNGAENIAAAKKIEFMLNDRLLNGYKDFYTNQQVPPNQDYLNLLYENQINEYSKEAFDSFMATADQYAPVAPVAEEITATPVAEEIAPVAETAPIKEKYEAIKPKPTKEPRMARATPAEQATAEILTEEPKVEKKKRSAWSWAKEHLLDNGMVFEDLSLATGNRELQAKWNSIRYSESKAQRLMGNGSETDNVKSLNAIREEVEKTGKVKQFYSYLYHKHNIDRMTLETRYKDVKNKPVFGNSVTAEESQKVVDLYEAKYPAFKNYANDVYSYMGYLRQQLVDGGVISSETAKLWSEMYPNYVPIRRLGDEGLNINVPLDTGRTGVNAPIKRAKGGNRDILPLFDTMGQRTMQTYKAIAKNRFGIELKNTLGTTIANEVTSVDEAIDSVDTQDGLLQKGDKNNRPTFTVFENGEKVTFEITEEMYDAMKPTDGFFSGTNKTLNTISNIRRGTLTEYNPWFMLKNAVKDIQDVLINSQHPVRTYAAVPKAIKQMATNGQWYKEYMDNGGEQNSYFDSQTNEFKEENKTLETAKKVFGLDAISKANNIIERLPRLAEYIASRESGKSVDVAMLDSARVTTNFAAGGDVVKWANRNGATFLNASVQGAVQQARNIREAKMNGLKGWASLAGKYVAAGLPAVLLNGLIWDDDEEYEELSDYVKQNYYIVGKFGDGKFVRIPKGRTVAVIQNAFEQMGNLITGNDEVDLGTFLELVAENLAPNNPLDNNIISPIVQVARNEAWYGGDLVPTRLQDLPAEEQYDESTDSISRWLGETFNVSPYKVNYLLDQYSGVVGDTFLPMLTPEAESGDDSFLGNMIAPLKDMFTTDSVMNNQNVSDFYDLKDELAVTANGSNATDEDILMSKFLNSVSAELSELYTKKREIQNSSLSDEWKYKEVRKIQEQIVALTKEGLGSYEDIRYEGDGEYAVIGDTYFQWYKPEKGDPYWRKLSDEQKTKYIVTSAAGDANYATDGNVHYRRDEDGEWTKISDNQLARQQEVTKELGISPEEYWSKTDISFLPLSNGEYEYAYDNPGKYAVSKVVADDYETYCEYRDVCNDFDSKDENGESVSGLKKERVLNYINGLDIDYGQKIILFRSMYDSKDDKATYNADIVDYLNSRDDISYEEMVTILEELGMEVDSEGNVSW